MTALQQALKGLTDDEAYALAVKFEVAKSTAYRWLRGVARPYPLIAQQIIAAIDEMRGGSR